MNTFSNILLISGSGRNVGKTTLACGLIKNLSKKHDVVGIKISSHLHELSNDAKIIEINKKYTISQELSVSNKDSSRMLQARAKIVYYIQAQKEYLGEAFNEIIPFLPENAPIICESGGLRKIIVPGLYFQVINNDQNSLKNLKLSENADMILKQVNGEWEEFDFNNVVFEGDCFKLNF